jgi:hypothetical protein
MAGPQATSPTADASFKLQQFGGMLPAWDAHLLPDGQAGNSVNGYLFSGALSSWRKPKPLFTTKTSNPGYVYRLPDETEATASALLNIAGPIAGDTVTVGEETYTFTAAVNTSSPSYTVLLGASAAAAAINLFAALTFDNGQGTNAGVLYGIGTVANPAIDQTSPTTKNTLATNPPRITVVAPDTGAAFNTTAVSESTGAARLAWTFNAASTTHLAGGANVTLDTDITSPSVFLEFADPNTDVVRSPVVDDSFDRYYMASSSLAPIYNTRARIEAGQPAWMLGVPAPGCTPGVSVTGGGNTSTIGFPTTISGNAASPGANIIYLIPIMPTGAVILNDVSFVTQSDNPTAQYAAVLFEDLNGSPHTRLNTGVSTTGVATGGTAVSAFTNPTGLLANTQYWIGFMTDTAIVVQFADDTGSQGVVSLNTYSGGPPSAITNETVGYPDLQVWGDLTTSAVLEARSYVYTYITAYGEESAPSPPTLLTGWSNAVWNIDLFQPPPDQIGVTRNITNIRLYRTITATGGTTTYFQVINPATTTPVAGSNTTGDMPVTTASYVDTVPDSTVALNNQLQSQLWTPPPEGLQGFVVMPNGIIAGWKANEIWFCQPYFPHAWPASYVQTTEYPIVGLGVTGSSVVAATTGAPYISTGVSPSSMTAIKVQNSEPCHSRKSVLGNTDGVYYASRNGLILVSQSGTISNITETWITREKWQQLTPQANLVAVFLVSQYYAWETAPNGNEGTLGQRGFTVELNATDQNSFTIWPQPGGHRLGFQLLSNSLPTGIAMVEIDPWSANCIFIARNEVYYLDFTDPAPTLTILDWTSKLLQQKTKKNFEAMRIAFSVPPNTPAQNATRATNPTADPFWTSQLPSDRYGFILVYADNQLVTAREIRKPQEVLRILSGFKHETWQFRVISRVLISGIQVGSSVKGMGNV